MGEGKQGQVMAWLAWGRIKSEEETLGVLSCQRQPTSLALLSPGQAGLVWLQRRTSPWSLPGVAWLGVQAFRGSPRLPGGCSLDSG